MFEYIISTNISITMTHAEADSLDLILPLLEMSIKTTCLLLHVFQTILLNYCFEHIAPITCSTISN